MGVPVFASIETPLRIARAKSSPLFRDTPCRITTGPDSKAAMNRPKRFRGLATDPSVQRKAPRTVIQRENKPKGPRLERKIQRLPARQARAGCSPGDLEKDFAESRRFHEAN